jgi:deoxyhypusine synthase
VKGYDFNKGVDYHEIFKTFGAVGSQSTNLGKAIEIIEEMATWRLSDDPIELEEEEHYKNPELRAKTKCTIFLGYTSNMVSMGT